MYYMRRRFRLAITWKCDNCVLWGWQQPTSQNYWCVSPPNEKSLTTHITCVIVRSLIDLYASSRNLKSNLELAILETNSNCYIMYFFFFLFICESMVLLYYKVIGCTHSVIVFNYKFNFYSKMFKINDYNVKINLANCLIAQKLL